MKLFIFHGPGTAALNSKVSDIKKNFEKSSVTEIEGKEINENEIQSILTQRSLFNEDGLVIIHNPLSLNVEKISSEKTLVLTFSKTLPSNSVLIREAQKKGAQVIAFSEEKEMNIFPFLDALTAKNPKAYVLLKSLFKEYGSQYLLTMIAFSLRRLVNPPKNLPPFVLQKIQNQKKQFPQDSIKKLYKTLLETDYKIKTGVLEEETAVELLSQRFFE